MAVQDWSTNPAQNTTIDGVFIGEDCPPGNMNDMGRRIMASVRVMYDNLPDAGTFVTKVGATFTDQPRVTGRGGLLHHNNPANTSARLHVQASGGSIPAMANGDLLAEW